MIWRITYKVNKLQSNIHGQYLQNLTLHENDNAQKLANLLRSSLSMQEQGLKDSIVLTWDVGIWIISKFFRMPSNSSKKSHSK